MSWFDENERQLARNVWAFMCSGAMDKKCFLDRDLMDELVSVCMIEDYDKRRSAIDDMMENKYRHAEIVRDCSYREALEEFEAVAQKLDPNKKSILYKQAESDN